MCIALTANAQFADGKYYLQNVESGKYWGAANDWGTRASLIKNPDYVTLIANEDGTYNLESQVSNGGTNYYFGGDYMDGQPVAGGLTITASGDYYTIANGDNYFGYDGSSAILGKNLAADSKNALWNIIPEADMVASLAKATADAPVDATFLIIDHTFGRNNRNVGAWNNTGGAALTGGNSNKHCAEKYHGVFDVNQVLANAPKGVYKFTAQGFYRQDGEDNDNLPVFYINDVTTTIPVKTGSENSMADACASFEKGLYAAEPLFIELEEAGDLTVGVKLAENANLWVIWDNFELTYYGPDADVAKIQLADYIAQVEALRAKAEELKDKNISSVTKEAIEAALTASAEIEATKEAYNTAIAALTAANNKAEADIKNWAAIEALSTLTDNTNVYTAEAFEAYEKIRGDYKTAWEEGTLTETVVNPEVVAGWHSANTFDDLLLSAWTIGGAQCKDFDTALYINTWSVEGDTDGTNFRVPFFEYWTGDANSLGANELTATLTEIPAGDYVVTAWVRARAKNGVAAADATGITLSANGGEAVDVTEGEGVDQFNIGEYKANATVGEDGKLTITFNVAADNNVSWLSFKNVKYMTPAEAEAEELQKNFEKALPTIKDGNYYQIYTEVGEATYYLTAEGKLTANEEEAKAFEFNIDKTSGPYSTAWSINKFTNPSLSDGSTGDVVNDGALHMNNANRSGWERQVFFYNGKEYAVRSTNSSGTSWGANTYWAVITDNELPEAGYSLSPDYAWQLKDVTTEVLVASANDLLAEAEAVVEAKEGVGKEFFQITEEAYNTYADAVKAAAAVINNEEATEEEILAAVTALRAANDVYAAAPRVAPKEGKPYVFELTTSAGTYALSISADGIKIAEEGTNVYFKDMGNGTYALGNENGEYVVYEGSNNWTMKASADAYGWTISTAEGGYTIKGKSGLLGTNTSDGAAAGSPCYGDKNASNGYVVWAITPAVIFNETPLTKDMFKGWDGFDATASVNNETPYWDAAELGAEVGPGNTIFGSGNVTNTDYADVTGAEVLRIEGTPGVQLRVLINRQADNSLVEINPTINEKGYVDVDFTEYEYVHINAIKLGWGSSAGTITAMTLNPGFFKFEWAYDFEADKEGVNIVGAGTIVDDENAAFGKVFENVGGAVRTNYLTLPEDVLAQSVESKQLSIAFWVNAEGKALANPYAPFFTAYGSNTNGADNTFPMLALQSRGLAQVNCNGWTDFTGADNVDGKDNVYNQNAWEANDAAFNFVENWIDDSDWHYYTAVFTEEGLTIYLDGEVKNQWTCDGTEGHNLAGLFSNGADLKHICLGGNQAWNWGDGDAPYRFDDVLITNYVLTPEAIKEIIDAKLADPNCLKTYELAVENIAIGDWTTETLVDAATINEAASLLGAEASALTFQLVDETGVTAEYNGNPGEILFWVDYDGNKKNWGNGNKYYILYDAETPAITSTQYTAEAGKALNVVVRLANAEGKYVEFKLTETMEEAVSYKPEIAKTIEIEGYDKAATAYSDAYHPTFDVAEVTAALGIDDIADAKTYIVNVTTGDFVVNSTDGWRDANGDAKSWGEAENGYCLKLNDPASGEFDYAGAHDANFEEGTTYVAQWGIVANEKAVLLKVTIKFLSEADFAAVGINGINTTSTLKNGKYLENNKVVIIRNGVKYGVNGAAIKSLRLTL